MKTDEDLHAAGREGSLYPNVRRFHAADAARLAVERNKPRRFVNAVEGRAYQHVDYRAREPDSVCVSYPLEHAMARRGEILYTRHS